MTWDKGSGAIQFLLSEGRLERVTASLEQAEILVADARRHLVSASLISEADPLGAYVLTYDAARKSIAGILEAQGLRATAKGGHVVLFDAAMAQFDPPLGKLIRPFNRMRARRNQVEYASSSNPEVTTDEVLADIEKARDLINLATQVLPRVDEF
ncbi:hypothetical protein E1263_32545 [Kribbella antibiotica]|uniref:HEPN domain-containing protein n=1 Tax=Kribbella antibiotica TaxID=190195 RepID=A0A4R4YUL8_9ACTN|nr:hypothetical protein [Kribbella antibiotica]TDD49078.1 hypothetical protein E1263_32545 [Kribbella antibiotica]